jgi:hypothetical protein
MNIFPPEFVAAQKEFLDEARREMEKVEEIGGKTAMHICVGFLRLCSTWSQAALVSTTAFAILGDEEDPMSAAASEAAAKAISMLGDDYFQYAAATLGFVLKEGLHDDDKAKRCYEIVWALIVKEETMLKSLMLSMIEKRCAEKTGTH